MTLLLSDIQVTEGTPLGVTEAHHHAEEPHQGFSFIHIFHPPKASTFLHFLFRNELFLISFDLFVGLYFPMPSVFLCHLLKMCM